MIYFIQGEQTKLIKIGRTRDVRMRANNLQMASPDKLSILAVIDYLADDGDHHRQFRQDWVYGEWFRPSEALLAFIAALPVTEYVGPVALPRNHVVNRPLEWDDRPNAIHPTSKTRKGVKPAVGRVAYQRPG